MVRRSRAIVAVALASASAACAPPPAEKPLPIASTAALPPRPYALAGPLRAGLDDNDQRMGCASESVDGPELDGSPQAETIRRGFRIFTNTPHEAPAYTHATVSCSNCHLNAGQREPRCRWSGSLPSIRR